MKSAVIIGGSGGIGLTLAHALEDYDKVYLLDIKQPDIVLPDTFVYRKFDVTDIDYDFLKSIRDEVKMLIITAGFGHLQLFKDINDGEIEKSFAVNTVGVLKAIRFFYPNIMNKDAEFQTIVMVSISGIVSSPFFSIYSATKAALHRFIESVNVELEKGGSVNRILEVSPGSINNTGFNGGTTDIDANMNLAREILVKSKAKEMLFIPQYEEVFKGVINRYQSNPHKFGLESYQYKIDSGRIKQKSVGGVIHCELIRYEMSSFAKYLVA